MAESVAASARSHLTHRPFRDEFAQDLAARAARKGSPRSDEDGLDVSSLVAPIALAPDDDTAGKPLRDLDALEVPLGHSADPDLDALLTDEATAALESTGSALRTSIAASGVHEELTPRQKRLDAQVSLTARPSDESLANDDAYDAVAPDDLGAEWLNRATEAGTLESRQSAREAMPPELMLESAMSGISEGSVNAASAERLEGNASAELEEDDVDLDDWESPSERNGQR
jgi:hypothetical protein